MIFDSDPSVTGKTPSQQSREMSRAMIRSALSLSLSLSLSVASLTPSPLSSLPLLVRGMMDENNEQFVAYFLPTPDTLGTRLTEESEGTEGDPDQE